MHANFKKYEFEFIQPMGTSRGVLFHRDIYILILYDQDSVGFGECAPLTGLSFDDRPDYSGKLQQICSEIRAGYTLDDIDLGAWPSILFGLETAFLALQRPDPWRLFDSAFIDGSIGIPINGLVVMSDIDRMLTQAREKVAAGFDCIKFKIGALDFDAEYEMLSQFRTEFPAAEIRLDANGAFSPDSVLSKIETLAELRIHSLEQPIKPRQWSDMAEICAHSDIAIALDEELIGVHSITHKFDLLNTIHPRFIVLKPSLLGGFRACEEWIASANDLDVGFWVTSMLESNVGLNALSQWVATREWDIPQGLGTGMLYRHNFPSALQIKDGFLRFEPHSGLPDVTSLQDICMR